MAIQQETRSLVKCAVGQWVLEERLAMGRYSEVYRAHHGESHQDAVVKVLRSDLDDPKEGDRALAREREALSACSHPGIPQAMKRVEVTGRHGLLMSYCFGHPVIRLVREVPNFDRFGVLRALARLIAHVHQRGFVHGDISLENVLMAPNGRVFLTGFSNARRERSGGSEMITRVFRKKNHQGGPFTYLAPEIMGSKSQTKSSDVFAFGVCAFLMLTKQRPYPVATKEAYLALAARHERADIIRYHSQMPRTYASIINRCVCMDPATRITDGQELSDSFDVFFGHTDSPKPSELSKQFAPRAKDAQKEEGDIRWMD